MRYLPLTEENRNEMLDTIGIEKVDELFSDVPSDIELNPKLNLPNYKTEMEVERYLSSLADRNLFADSTAFFLGTGA